MASSAVQLIGYIVALVGLSATIAATFMVEWKNGASKQGEGLSGIEEYFGLWSTCSIDTRTNSYSCLPYQSFINLKTEVQVTRALMLLSALLSVCGILVATVGLKCTNCLHGNKQMKNNTALAGGIFFMIAGFLALSITSWFASNIVQDSFGEGNRNRYEFGSALFVSWGGAILSLVGGALLGFRCPTRCSTQSITQSIRSSIKHPKLRPESVEGTEYV